MSADEQAVGAGGQDRLGGEEQATAAQEAAVGRDEAGGDQPGRRRGRPVLGAVAGLFLGIFLAIDLQQFAIRPLDNLSVIGLPLLGLALGYALGRFAPLRRRRADDDDPKSSIAGPAEADASST